MILGRMEPAPKHIRTRLHDSAGLAAVAGFGGAAVLLPILDLPLQRELMIDFRVASTPSIEIHAVYLRLANCEIGLRGQLERVLSF